MRKKKKTEREADRKTDELKEKRAKPQDTVQAVGRAMMAYAGLQPGEAGESATAKLKKEKVASEKAGSTKTNLHTDDSGDVLKDDVVKIVDDKDKDKGSSLKRKTPKERKKAKKAKKANKAATGTTYKEERLRDNRDVPRAPSALERRGDIEAMSAMRSNTKHQTHSE